MSILFIFIYAIENTYYRNDLSHIYIYIYKKKILYLKYMKDTFSSMIKRQANLKIERTKDVNR